jgi:predicted GNAT family N-acyltransferase
MATSQEYLREIAKRVDAIYAGALLDAADRLDALEADNKRLLRIGRTLIDADERGQGLPWKEAMEELNEAVTPNAELSGPRPLAAEGSRANDGLGMGD